VARKREPKRRESPRKSANEADAAYRAERTRRPLDAFSLSKAHRLTPIVPARPEQIAELDDDPSAYELELAWDGHRLLIARVADDVRFLSEDYRQWSDAFPTLVSALRRLGSESFVLEGWVCALGEDKRPSFEALKSHVAKKDAAELVLMLTDLLHVSGEDLSGLPLVTRRLRLVELLDGASQCLALSARLEGNSRDLRRSLARLSVPGFVARRRDQRHPPEQAAFVVSSTDDDVRSDRSLSAPGKVSNPKKVLYPRDGITKADVAEYYADIAPVLLPYLMDRPVVAQRWPDGIDDFTWYQHRVPPRAPDYVRAVFIEGNRRIVLPNRDALLWMVNLASLTLHGWASRVGSLDQPDWVVLDLDPGAKTKWSETIEVALTVRKLLELLDSPSVVKTSGQKGLHVLIPIAKGQSPLLAHELGQELALTIARLLPHLASVELDKARRGGRLFVDHLQNYVGKSLVLPYSLRAVDGAPVSAPLDWSEVGADLQPSRFNLKTLRKRLETKGDLALPLLSGSLRIEPLVERLRAANSNSS
jgi:DNA ligase D-like protein (predicted polymerase)